MTTDSPAASTLSGAEARRAARNASALAAASIVSKAALFGWQLILAPWLGAYAYGIYGTVGALFAIAAAIPAFGMGVIIIRDVARAPERAPKYLTAALFAQTFLALLSYVGVNLAAGAMGSSETMRAFVALAGLSLLVDIFGNMGNDLLLAQERMLATSAVEVGHILVRIGLAWAALTAGFGLTGVYLATILTGIGRSALLWGLLRMRPAWPLDRAVLWTLLVNSAPLAVSSFVGLAYQHVDKLMTTHFIGETSTGYLTAAFVVIFGVVNLISTTMLTATFPMMSRYYGDGRSPMFGFMVEKLAFFTIIITLPVSLTVSLFAADITVPLFGVDFRPTADVLAILIWYALVTMIANVFAQGMMIQNRQQRLLLIRAGGLGVNLILNLILLPVVGVRGAALASVCAETLVLAAMMVNFEAAGWTWTKIAPRVLRLALLGAVIAGSMVIFGKIHPVIGIAGGLGLYAAGVFIARVLAPDDWDLLYRMAAAMPGGARVLKYWRRDVPLNW